MKEKFQVTGMTCSACQNAVQKSVKKLDNIDEVEVNLITGDMVVTGTNIKRDQVVAAVKDAGYGIGNEEKKEEESGTSFLDQEKEVLRNRLLASFVFLIPLFYIAMGPMIGLPSLPILEGQQNALILALVQLFLTIPILFINRKFFWGGYQSLRHKSPTMDALVALGSGAAFIYGLFVIFQLAYGFSYQDMDRVHRYAHDLYFESAGMILTLITMGKYLEARAKAKTGSALEGLMDLRPKEALVRREGVESLVPYEDIREGDILLIKPGQSIPVDAIIIKGHTAVDESAITGESLPVDKSLGDKVIGATINQESYIEARAYRVGKDTTISKIIDLVKEAGASKAPIAKLADQISAVFVPAVIAISILTFIVWMVSGAGLEFALGKMIAVLVISCPCALGLATPVAIMVGTGQGAKHGILFKNAECLERLHKIQGIYLDKTGTITQGNPSVTDELDLGGLDQVKDLVYSLEKQSEHPLSKAILNYLAKEAQEVPLEKFENSLGQGLIGTFKEGTLLVGNEKLLRAHGVEDFHPEDFSSYKEEGKTALYVALDKKLLGVLAVADQIKEGSKEALDQLALRGLKTVMVTGDHELTAKAMAKNLSLDEVYAGIFPEEKDAIIQKGQEEGPLAMVGDGINDAPALTRADVGIAIGAGTDIAMESADLVLMKSDLMDVVTAWDLSGASLKNIKENLFWAFFYNIIGIPIAAGVFYPRFGLSLNPMLAALAMSLSSVFVVTNALRLNFFKPRRLKGPLPEKETRLAHLKEEENQEEKREESKEETMNKLELKVNGMSCGHCQKRVEDALNALEGVKAKVNLEEGKADISYPDEVSIKDLKDAVKNAGYQVES